MDNKVLLSKTDNYAFAPKPHPIPKPHTAGKRSSKRRNKRLKWVHVKSDEFKAFVKKIKYNIQLQQPDQACTI